MEHRILFAGAQIAQIEGVSRQAVDARFRRRRQPGQITLRPGWYRVPGLLYLGLNGMDTREHHEYLASLPAALDLPEAAKHANVHPAVLVSMGVVDDDETVNVRELLDVVDRLSAAR